MNNTIIAHRGASGYYCENTIAAFDYAYQLGCRHVELDCQLSGDGHVVIFHDDDLQRLSGVNLSPPTCDLAVLQQQDLHFHYDGEGGESLSADPQKIPSLAEFLQWLNNKSEPVWVNFEIKPGAGNPTKIALALADNLNHANLRTPPCISSFDFPALIACRDALKFPAEFALLYETWQSQNVRQANALGATAIHLWHENCNKEDVTAIKQAGMQLRIYTVNDKEAVAEFSAWGADGFFSDFPDRLL